MDNFSIEPNLDGVVAPNSTCSTGCGCGGLNDSIEIARVVFYTVCLIWPRAWPISLICINHVLDIIAAFGWKLLLLPIK
jgi:hypothetical protein